MATYYLKATSEDALWLSLEAAGVAYKQYDPSDPLNIPTGGAEGEEWSASGEFEWNTKDCLLDIIGDMVRETGNILTDEDGKFYPETEVVEGFHANLKAILTAEQEAHLPTISVPTTPFRSWAGDL